jgi:hypothetical protein
MRSSSKLPPHPMRSAHGSPIGAAATWQAAAAVSAAAAVASARGAAPAQHAWSVGVVAAAAPAAAAVGGGASGASGGGRRGGAPAQQGWGGPNATGRRVCGPQQPAPTSATGAQRCAAPQQPAPGAACAMRLTAGLRGGLLTARAGADAGPAPTVCAAAPAAADAMGVPGALPAAGAPPPNPLLPEHGAPCGLAGP